MFGLPLHPVVVHLPMGLAVVLPVITAAVAVAVWRQWLPRRAWLIVVLLQIALVTGALVSLRTGEDDEEAVERVVAEQHIEAHENAAKMFTGIAVANAVLGIAALMVGKRKAVADAICGLSAVGGIAVLAAGINVGHLGGSLVYKHGAGQAFSAPSGQRPDTGPRDDH